MDAERYRAIAQLPVDESAREEFPAGFPDPIDIPAARYTDSGFFELERTHVFEASWLFVAHAAQVPKAGDYLMLDALDRNHARTYDLEGNLRGFPEAKNFPRNKKSTCPPLQQVDCHQWGPLLFVKIRPPS